MSGKLPVFIVALGVLGVAFGCSQIESENHDRKDKHEAREHEDRERAERGATSSAVIEQGRVLYKANCTACHGETGKGDGPAAGVLKPPPRDHTDRAYMSTLNDKQISEIIKMGGAIRGKPLMPSHPQFKDPALAALVAYVRSLSESPK